MPPKRSSSTKPASKTSRPNARSSSRSSSISSTEGAASSKGRKSAATTATATASSTSLPTTRASGKNKKSGGFFDEVERVYDRHTTRVLNDVAGFLVVFIGIIYFTLSGYFFYKESLKEQMNIK